jgi:hypothetical protein
MTIPTDKPTRQCPYCQKEVVNLGLHVVSQHPSVIAQIEEKPEYIPASFPNAQVSPPYSQQIGRSSNDNTPFQSTRQLIREKLEDMMDIMYHLKKLMLWYSLPLSQLTSLKS